MLKKFLKNQNAILIAVIIAAVFMILKGRREKFIDRVHYMDYSHGDQYFPKNHCKHLSPQFKNAMGPECNYTKNIKLPGYVYRGIEHD